MQIGWRKKAEVIVIVGLMLVMTGCGFKLRGQANLPAEMAVTEVRSNQPPGAPPSSVGRVLSDLLRANGIEVVDNREDATAVLEILSESIRRRTVASDSQGDTREYTFTYNVDYRVALTDGRVLLPKDNVTISRDIIYAESDVLGREEGEALTLREMESSVAQSIIRRLEAVSRPDAASL